MSTTPYQFIKRGPERDRLVARLFAKIHKTTSCWVWTGTVAGGRADGVKYAYAKIQGKRRRVHRIMYELFRGPITDGLFVLHECDNPICLRPEHLHLGTQKQNCEEAVLRGRTARGARHGQRLHPERTARGTRHGQAKLNDELVRQVRWMSSVGFGCGFLASLHGVDWKTMRSVLDKETWKHVE